MLKVVKPSKDILSTAQGVDYFIGLSNKTANTKHMSMNLIIIPPGGSAEPHIHPDYESCLYVIEGSAITYYGETLEESVVSDAGQFLFVPPGILHQPFNLSKTEPVKAVLARNTPFQDEVVIHSTVRKPGWCG